MHHIKGPFWASHSASILLKKVGVNYRNKPVDIFRVDKLTKATLFDDVHIPEEIACRLFIIKTIPGWHGLVHLAEESALCWVNPIV